MEGLQMAQIIADLQSLQTADPAAARALLTPLDSKPAPASSAGTSAPQSRRGSGAPKFDRTGRRFVALPASRTPPLFSREGSSASMESYGGSGTSTPAGGAVTDTDNDLKRAKTLLELFEMRGKFKHMGDTGLSRAKQRVDDVVAKHAQSELDYREKDARTRYLRANK